MSVPTLDDLRVLRKTGEWIEPDGSYDRDRTEWLPLTPAEFDRIAREQGYVKVDEIEALMTRKAWHVLNAVAAFGHPGGSQALLGDLLAAIDQEAT